MKRSIKTLFAIFFLLYGNYGICQNDTPEPIKCEKVKNRIEGKFASSSQTSPTIIMSKGQKPEIGGKGEILVSFETSLFGGIVTGSLVIATAEVTAINGSKVTFKVLEKHSSMQINGKQKNHFTKGREAFFNQYEYDTPKQVDIWWPNKKLKASGYEVCDQKVGVWGYYSEEGVLLKSYASNDDGEIDGEYKEYYPNQAVSFLCTYDDGDREGPYEAYFKSGAIKEKGEYDYRGRKKGDCFTYFENGKEASIYNGTSRSYKEFYASGKTKMEGKYDYKGLKDGIWKEFYENGNEKSSIDYDDDEFEGYYKTWHENGTAHIEGKYGYDHLKEGDWKEYWPNGKKKKVESYTHGKVSGKVVEYYDNEQISRSSYFSSNELSGDYSEYFKDGKPKVKGSYKYGKKEGKWETYFEAGGVESSEKYKDDQKNGGFSLYSAPGILKETGTQFGEKLTGTYKYFFDSGKIKVQGNYSADGTKEGEWITFYENGKPDSKGSYANGVKTGKWLEHDANGKKKKVKY